MSRLLINNLSLIDVMKYYLNYNDNDFIKQGKYVYLTKCPIHKETKGTSLAIYDKTSKGQGWDWVCYGACGIGGTAPKLLVEMGLFDSIENAVKDIRKIFKLEYPNIVTLENFAEFKGFDIEFLKSRGIDNHKHVRNGEIIKGVVIPFYGADGDILAVKKRLKFEGTNKYTFTEGSNTIYGLDLLKNYNNDYLYIFEGETDALTAIQAGLQAIGVPGATAWETSTENLGNLLTKFNKIIAVPDQDKAGLKLLKTIAATFPDKLYTISLPTRFNDVSDYYMYNCGGNKEVLYKYFTTQTYIPATPKTFIATAKETPDILSKYDAWYYTFLALQDEVKIMLFVDTLKASLKISKTIITKAYNNAYKRYNQCNQEKNDADADIYQKNKCYYKTVHTNEGIAEVCISNFVIHLLHTIEADGNHVRICKLENERGQISRQVIFTAETLTRPMDFMAECKKAGNYIFKGDFKDLIALNEILLKQEENIVHSPDHIGQVNDIWIMGRYGIDNKGQIITCDDNNIITLDDKSYMVRNLNIVDDNDETYMPTKPDVIEEITDDYLKDVAYTLKTNLGTFNAWLSLGFIVAGWHSNAIYNHKGDKSFPIFFINGKRNSGKTYLARWLMSAYGFPHIDGKNFAMPSIVSMTRKLGYYSSLPLWYDDYKNNLKDIKHRDEFLLGAYNRQGADKGIKSGFGVRAEKIRGFLLLSGEDTPDNNAVFSRCCNIQISAYERDNNALTHMLDLVQHFPSLGLHFATKKQREGSEKLLAKIDYIQDRLMSQDIDGRLAKNVSVFAGAFLHEFEHVLTEKDKLDFINWLSSKATETKEITESDHTVSKFFSDMTVLMLDGKLLNGKHYKIENNTILLWFKGVYDTWVKNYPDADIKRTVLLDYIKKEPFFVKNNVRARLQSTGNQLRCLMLNYRAINNDDLQEICAANDDDTLEF